MVSPDPNGVEGSLPASAAAVAPVTDGVLLPPATVWQGLLEGRFVVASHALADDWTSLTLSTSVAAPVGFSVRVGAQIMQRVFEGCPQKTLAIELGCSPSTVSNLCSQALRRFGLDVCLRRAPLALVMLVSHLGGRTTPPGYQVLRGEEPGTHVVRMSRPEHALRSRLSRAEYEAVQLLVSGMSHEGIATVRARSRRTVANQFRSAAERLQTSGRFQLIRLAMQLDAEATG